MARAGAAAGAVAAAPAILHASAPAAEFDYKCGTALPDGHPMCIRGREAMDRIKEKSGGRLQITLYTNSVLGQDTAMISQTISGALQCYYLPIDLLAPRNPACGIFGVGFAFDGYAHIWEAMDGDLGNYLRELSEGIGFHVLPKGFDHGFRHITTRTKPITVPEDLRGFKIRLPISPNLISLFRHLGASPTPINLGEVYGALQTGVADGEENPLILIDTAKLYEVQKYCSMTYHVWAAINMSFGIPYWEKLPQDLQDLCVTEFSASAMSERQDWQKMSADEIDKLTKSGLAFNKPDTAPFREELKKNGFYPEMKKESGDKAWALLEQYVGSLI